MKFVHLSDLHLGKRVNGFSLLEDQRYILRQILEIVEREAPDGVLIAGDVYDKSVPSAEAVGLLDEFLTALAELGPRVFLISGNHDSPERLAFGGRLMGRSGVHVTPVYAGTAEPVELRDEHGPVRVYLLPFLRPSVVRRFHEGEAEPWTEALRLAVEAMDIDSAVRNVLVAHQFVTGAERSESEEVSVGGADNVDAAVFAAFDYVALGHIHRPQNVGGGNIRYCGTPLKYAFSEAGQEKSVTVAELGKKGELAVRTVPLRPLRDMRQLRGTYEELTARSFYQGTDYPDSYLHITLTDEEDVPEALGRLRTVYPWLMRLDYDNARTRSGGAALEAAEEKPPLELFAQLYARQNGQPMTDRQQQLVEKLIAKIWEGEA